MYCIIKHYAMKMYWGSGVLLHAFSTSALDGGEWLASRASRFTPGERNPGSHWMGGWGSLYLLHKFLVGNPEGKRTLEDQGVDGKILE
jgi:hypothetical protein